MAAAAVPLQPFTDRIKDIQSRLDAVIAKSKELSASLPEPTPTIPSPPPFTNEVKRSIEGAARGCEALNLRSIKFLTTPSDYYDWSLDERRRYLGASSTAYLCKSLLVENKNFADGRPGSKYYCIIVQYTTSFSTQKLEKALKAVHGGQCHIRFVEPDVAKKLSGADFNGVAPVGLAEPVPLILSDRIADLSEFWVGGGHVNVKLRLSVAEFIEKAAPLVLNITQAD